ncbi:DsbA family oxidoreductase [Haloglomus halophilum]|uniref:DsbA family oxidoreductase n=1 Tax=Haloglomus halophilum TaxID=2962672 RepID=UPI0020C9E233|nr:DsbA family protein [Haloglomus halophilum]
MPETVDSSVTLTQFTDPMCTWCWGSEPVLRRLRTVYGDQLRLEFVLGGLVEDFDAFYDAGNDIAEPSDVGPHWREASEQHGMPVETAIFETNPARSTYPASIAFAAARLQDRERAHRYLRLLREAYATQARNVNERAEQVALAEQVGLDVAAFTGALDDGTARAAFEDDLARTRNAGVRAFPTYRIEGAEETFQLAGFQSFDALADRLEAAADGLEQSSPPTIRAFVADHGPVATQEVATVYDLARGKARQALQSLTDEDALRREQRGNGYFWHAVAGGASQR